MNTSDTQTSQAASNNIDIARANELFEKGQSELLAIDPKTVKKPRITHQRAAELSSILTSSLEPRWDRFKDIFLPKVVKEYRTQYEQLSNYALIFFAAGAAFENNLTTEEAKALKQLIPIVAEHDAYMISWFRPAFRNNTNVLNVIDNEIAPGRSRLDSAEDVLRLCQLGMTHKHITTTQTPLTEAYFGQAEADATRLFQLLAKENISKHASRDLWHRAYTQWDQAYDSLQAVASFVFRDEDDAQELFPRISQPRKKKISSDNEPTKTPSNPLFS